MLEKDKTDDFDAEGDIDIDGVYFSYDSRRPLITDFNLNVTKGERIADETRARID